MKHFNRHFVFVCGLFFSVSLFASSGSAAAGSSSITHRMMFLAIQLGLLLFATRLGNLLFERWRLPGVLGELAAGMVLGPFALGAIGFPGFPHGLFPQGSGFAVSPELYAFCSVASIVLLFMVGLETDLRQFLRYSLAGSVVGIGGVVVSFVFGAVLTSACSGLVFGEPLGFMAPQCLFLGVVSTATSVGITARILAEKRKLDSPEGVTILAGAVVDDVLGIVLLTVILGVVAASADGGSLQWGRIGLISLKAVGVWLVATFAGLLLSRRIGSILKRLRSGTPIAVMALGLALVVSGLFEEAGLAMIIGAYVTGLSLSRTDIAQLIREKLAPVYGFLVPVFFGVMGMLVNLRALGSGPVLLFGLVYSLVAIGAKLLGSGVPALLFGFNRHGAMRIGAGMVPRGEVALIVAGIGLAAGVLSPDVFGVAILMTVITTVAAPPFLVLLFNQPVSGLRRPAPEVAEETLRFRFPAIELMEWVFSRLTKVFEAEGFFVHTLEHEHAVVQVRRDRAVVNLWPSGSEIVFACDSEDAPLVRTAVFEVVGELRGVVEGLQAPMDVASVVGDLQAAPASGTHTASHLLLSTLDHHLVIPRLQAGTKEEVIAELLERLCDRGLVLDRDQAWNDLMDRERSMSTGLQRGVAIPHARTGAVDRLVCVLGLKSGGVDFQALDDRPSSIFVLTLSPAGEPAPHVQLMSEISQLLSPSRCTRLLQSGSAAEVLEVLQMEPGRLERAPATEPVSSSLTPPSPHAEGQFSLAHYLNDDLILPRLEATDKNGAIRELAECICRVQHLGDPEPLVAALLERETLMSTGLEKGIAVPHCRLPLVSALTCAIGMAPQGIPFQSSDGKPARLIVLTVAPTTAAPYIQFMASLLQTLEDCGLDTLVGLEHPSHIRRHLLEVAGSRSRHS